ncbi:energy-coupling factor ABC transporter permease [Tepidiforma flava]|uniref:Energy-coupling factor ABC transporter permease n=1 Tax=Tepidiforma flava TaxID=3004094 RepID=A0ABY7M4W2_9CHLR|nr:energy-coupling factor ABC transporter permease [Tepidiforma flava]WBL35134.1 energy-coupling factor ABC transporter permease [Tepidiforma flava]
MTPIFLLHAADGFFSVPVSIVFWVITAAALAVSLRQVSARLDDRAIPLMGVMAAFIFAGQMFNFQIPGGTSGHLLGGVLAAVLLGPYAAAIVMACVIAVQAIVFQDGGLVVLGVNIFNMGLIGTFGGYAVYRAVAAALGGEAKGRLPAAAVAAWLSVVAAAVVCSFQLAVSGTTSLEAALVAMVGWHVIIGIGEAIITVGALAFIQASRADLLTLRDAPASS